MKFIQEYSKELVDVIMRPLSMIFELPWQSGEILLDWKLVSFSQFSERERGMILGTIGQSVTFQCLVKLQGRLF